MSDAKEKQRAANRRWRLKHKAECAARMREWRRKNADHYRAWAAARRPEQRKKAFVKRRMVLGRICADCGRRDEETSFQTRAQCAACSARALYNGRCRRCDSIRVRVRVDGRWKKSCPENCREEALSDMQVRLWDWVRWRDDSKVTLRQLADVFGLCLRSIERKKESILTMVREHDPEAAWRVDDEQEGRPLVLSFRSARVAAGLERVCVGSVQA